MRHPTDLFNSDVGDLAVFDAAAFGVADPEVAHEDIAHEVVARHLRRGALIEVRCRFNGTWSRGFIVDQVDDDGVFVRRLTDGALLPVAFEVTDIRSAISPT